MAFKPGQRRQQFQTEFMVAMRGIAIGAVKQALGRAVPSANFFESSKSALASRYAKGKMSMGGSQESQAFIRMDIQALARDIRDDQAARSSAALTS